MKLWILNADKKTPDSLEAIFKEYQIHAINVVWAHPEGVGSGAVWKCVSTMLSPKTISRASIIFFLNKLVDNDVLDFEEATGKGGHHRLYKPAMDWGEFEDLIVWRFIEKLMLIFPEKELLEITELRGKIPA